MNKCEKNTTKDKQTDRHTACDGNDNWFPSIDPHFSIN